MDIQELRDEIDSALKNYDELIVEKEELKRIISNLVDFIDDECLPLIKRCPYCNRFVREEPFDVNCCGWDCNLRYMMNEARREKE